jgi:hypothetical protein
MDPNLNCSDPEYKRVFALIMLGLDWKCRPGILQELFSIFI